MSTPRKNKVTGAPKDTYPLLLTYAFRVLTIRQYSVFELQRKLSRKTDNAEVIKEVMDRLFELKYLNDYEFAKSFIDYKGKIKPLSRTHLILEFKKKGINKEIIAKVLAETNFDEQENIDRVFLKKLKSYKPDLPLAKRKAKMQYYLGSRGFNWDLIQQKLAEMK